MSPRLALMLSTILLTASATLPALAQPPGFGPPGQQSVPPATGSDGWSQQAETVFPCEAVIARGFIPIMAPRAFGPVFTRTFSLLNLDGGKAAWSVEAKAAVSVNLSGDNLLVAFEDHLGAFDLTTGKAVWQLALPFMGADKGHGDLYEGNNPLDLGQQLLPGQSVGGVILCHKGKMFLAAAGNVYAINPADGKVVWWQKFGFQLGSPLAALGDLVVAVADDKIIAWNAETGVEAWRSAIAGGGHLFVSPEGEIYFTIFTKTRNEFCRLDPKSGQPVWTAPLAYDLTRDFTYDRWHIVGDRIVVVRHQSVAILKRDTGEIVWSEITAPSNSAVGAGHIYYWKARDVNVRCVNVADCKLLWEKSFPQNRSDRFLAVGDEAIVQTANAMVAYDGATGKQLWSHEPTRYLFAAGSWDTDGKAVTMSCRPQVRAADLQTGKWIAASGNGFEFATWVHRVGERVLVHSSSGTIPWVSCIELRPPPPAQ